MSFNAFTTKLTAALLLPLLFSCSSSNPEVSTTPSSTASASSPSGSRPSQMLQLTNQFRQNKGRRPLIMNAQLKQAAQQHADYMAANNLLSHDQNRPGYFKPNDRIKKAGYQASHFAENVYRASSESYGTSQRAYTGWINSSGHRKNLLGKAYTETGIGHNNGHWVQVFATPAISDSLLDSY